MRLPETAPAEIVGIFCGGGGGATQYTEVATVTAITGALISIYFLPFPLTRLRQHDEADAHDVEESERREGLGRRERLRRRDAVDNKRQQRD